MTVVEIVDILGTVAFAISGASAAMRRKLDPFGVIIVSFATAAGGGTIRDVLVGIEPVSWMTNPNLIYTILISVFISFLFRRYLVKISKTLFLFDAIGIGLYTVVGVEIGITAGLPPLICVTLGCITACFGGVLRDVLLNKIPVLFRRNIYATACIIGGFMYFGLKKLGVPAAWTFPSAAITVILIRLLAVTYKIELPSPYKVKS
ncbi:membrane protein [Nonlabens sp. MIC269]|uniref:trimeric intracellular cation channel family protein n=1 Tax=Nonlabens TaxID=363408 RepID=UPI000721DAD2|nr:MULTISPECIES: trimeric intracellular cation channel family protein [Nonlabens]ALM20394.1 membrane protein [Nonlabens sp. MIC269]ARN70543.1 hypothetical protein BST91_02145 [Nonlabens tegetincola]MEE2800869.1 trimeric intracellular cation channel family protein [Bacteroidota bacterium]PQJ19402.1 hypothetical protein BST93_06510 [Nonlabens tegetincola]